MAYGLRNRGVAKADIERRVAEAAKLLAIDTSSSASRASSPAASASASPWAAPSCASRRPSCSTSRCPTSTPSCACRCAPRSARLHNRLKATSIFVTHDQVEAMTLADMVVVMNAGRIEQIGAPTQVYRLPATRFVATFIGSPAMNLLPGRIVAPGMVETSGGRIAFRAEAFDCKAAARTSRSASAPRTCASASAVRATAGLRQGLRRGAGRHAPHSRQRRGGTPRRCGGDLGTARRRRCAGRRSGDRASVRHADWRQPSAWRRLRRQLPVNRARGRPSPNSCAP